MEFEAVDRDRVGTATSRSRVWMRLVVGPLLAAALGLPADAAEDLLEVGAFSAPDQAAAATETRSPSPARRQARRVPNARVESDDWTFRPTVLVRRGSSQGSGTIIASVEGETLIATAAHVVRASGPMAVELHRYNLGVENLPQPGGRWPLRLGAELVASDLAADVAILRVRMRVALPYTARLAPENEEPASHARLTSVGIDLGSKLSSWDTNLVDIVPFELNDSGSDRPFLITAQIPEHGRSGGGLYDSKGRLVAVCVGHAELVKGRRMGIFSSLKNVRELLQAHELTSVVARSEARRAHLSRRPPARDGGPLTPPARPSVTPTEASRDEGRSGR